MEKISAIVLAAGKGSRMHSDIPKQYLKIDGKEILYYALKAFERCPYVHDIVLVTSDPEYCREEIVEAYHLEKISAIVTGGAERSDSVYEGLKACAGADYVMIHDGARPVVDQELLLRNIEEVRKSKACISAVRAKDTIKVVGINGEVVDTPDRSTLWQVQTPQSFSYDLIMKAHEKLREMKNASVTDDAMVVEKTMHHKVTVAEGSYKNIKVTTPEDLEIAEIFLGELSKTE